jgi:ornithine carbamoyltransferase
MAKHFLELSNYSMDELNALLDLSAELKTLYRKGGRDTCLLGKSVMMIFDKPSTRTRVSFEVAINQLGGSAVYSRSDDVGRLGEREPIKDIARVLNGYVDMIVVRTFAHASLQELAQFSTIPVINALTDQSHPCQAMADMLTIREHCGQLAGKKLVFIGDGNNMAQSLALACVKLGLDFSVATPEGYALNSSFWEKLSGESRTKMQQTNDPIEAAQGADIVYTDTWVSMGQEDEKQHRQGVFAAYRVDETLMAAAAADARIMHCLPAYRGLEISDELIESSSSIIFQQAENRLHFQRALLKYLNEA